MLLDQFLGHYDFNEVHATVVRAHPEAVFRAIWELAPEEVPLFRELFWIRSLPGRLSGLAGPDFAPRRGLLEQMLSNGFVLLGVEQEREVVVGVIGQFWKLRGGAVAPIASPQEFLGFDRPDYARAAMNFSVEAVGGVLRLRTETRIAVPDAAARQRFGLYWRVVMPGSALIRRMWLRSIRLRAERG